VASSGEHWSFGKEPGRSPEHFNLNPAGTDYVVVDVPADIAIAPAMKTLRHALSQNPTPLTRQKILDRWPESEPRPRADSLWRSLQRGCELDILARFGKGTKTEAFRYRLAEGSV
jgi:hypothetical protein